MTFFTWALQSRLYRSHRHLNLDPNQISWFWYKARSWFSLQFAYVIPVSWCNIMVKPGHIWIEDETRALLENRSKESVQRQLWRVMRNSQVYAQVVEQLVKHNFLRMVPRCWTKMKALQKIQAWRLVISWGLKLDGNQMKRTPIHLIFFFLFFFTELDAVMGGRASVAPVHILDSSAGRNSTIKKDASDMKARKQRSWLMFLAPPPATLQLLPQLSANPQLQPPLSAAPQLLPPLSAAPQLQPPLSAREL